MCDIFKINNFRKELLSNSMIMDLPEGKFFMKSMAQIEGGMLEIKKLERFEDLMYELTYAIRKRRCIYCGRRLSKETSTLDHRYPRASGGISITNNLFPSCSKCNSAKGDLVHEEYLCYRSIKSKKQQKVFLKKVRESREKIFREKGFLLPSWWISYVDLESIQYRRQKEELRGRRYHRIAEFYDIYGKLNRPVIVDCNSNLLDGYNILLYANDMNINIIPIIRLENVRLLLKN